MLDIHKRKKKFWFLLPKLRLAIKCKIKKTIFKIDRESYKASITKLIQLSNCKTKPIENFDKLIQSTFANNPVFNMFANMAQVDINNLLNVAKTAYKYDRISVYHEFIIEIRNKLREFETYVFEIKSTDSLSRKEFSLILESCGFEPEFVIDEPLPFKLNEFDFVDTKQEAESFLVNYIDRSCFYKIPLNEFREKSIRKIAEGCSTEEEKNKILNFTHIYKDKKKNRDWFNI